MLNNNQVIQTPYKKHLGINDKLKFLKPLLKKLTSPSNYYVNFRGSYQDHHELLYINPVLGLISSTETLSLITRTVSHSTKS